MKYPGRGATCSTDVDDKDHIPWTNFSNSLYLVRS
jgi:hypothetical protein